MSLCFTFSTAWEDNIMMVRNKLEQHFYKIDRCCRIIIIYIHVNVGLMIEFSILACDVKLKIIILNFNVK